MENELIIEFAGNINSLERIDHIQKNEIMWTQLVSIACFNTCMFFNDINYKMAIIFFRNHTRTYECRPYLCKFLI
jgi:hypothetical protein